MLSFSRGSRSCIGLKYVILHVHNQRNFLSPLHSEFSANSIKSRVRDTAFDSRPSVQKIRNHHYRVHDRE